MTDTKSANKLLKQYSLGFILSIFTTAGAYWVVVSNQPGALWIIFGLALLQAVIQLYYFLHLGEELRPRLRLLSLVFMMVILLIVVGGSLWIMHQLNY
ncbi:MAG: cytochrome o ubiquinol oxidase subunit IV, partial [Candidatus Saccharimonadales bacterium]